MLSPVTTMLTIRSSYVKLHGLMHQAMEPPVTQCLHVRSSYVKLHGLMLSPVTTMLTTGHLMLNSMA